MLRRQCRERGLRLTVQRRAVLEAVLDLHGHPNADQVYDVVARRVAGISRTTIYRALDHLVATGVITRACHPGRIARYDGRNDKHHHLVCMQCDRMVDIIDPSLDALPLPDTRPYDFEVRDFRVQLRGLCGRCRNQLRKEASE